jgi:ubiquinone/menaquinone biosynthesis C-methylase UbiE
MAHDHGDAFARPRLYDAMRHVCSFGAARRIDQRAAELLLPYAPGTLLDVGCGTGALTMALRRHHPAAEVIGVDPGEVMLEQARRKAVRAGLDIDFRVGRGQQLPVDDAAVDAVTISLALHHFPADDVPLALAEMLRVLRPGGVLLVVELAPVGRLARRLSPHAHEHQLARYAGLVREAGFTGVRTGRLTPRLLGYVSGLAPTIETARDGARPQAIRGRGPADPARSGRTP